MKTSRVNLAAVIVFIATANLLACRYLGRPTTPDVLSLAGPVEAHESVLSFLVSGRIADLPVDEGKWIEQDAIVARLDDTDYRQREANGDAALRLAQAQLALALAGRRPEEVEAYRHAMLNLKAQVDQDRMDYARIQTLYQNSTVSQEERDQAETSLKRADAAYNQARQIYLEARAGTRKEDIAVARATVDQASEALEYARIQLAHTILRAPFAGQVIARKAEPGEIVAPGAPIVMLVDLDHVWISASVSASDAARLRIDSLATVRVSGAPAKTFHGRVAFIAEQAESVPAAAEPARDAPTSAYRVKIDIENPHHQLKLGTLADVAIELPPRMPAHHAD